MADRPFRDLYDYVMPYLPGAEPGIIDFHIRRVLREFFKRTTAWRQTFDFGTTAEMAAYQLQPGTNKQVSSILSVRWGDNYQRLDVLPEGSRDPNWAPGPPRGWFNLLPSVISFAPTPSGEYPVRVEAALTLPIEVSTVVVGGEPEVPGGDPPPDQIVIAPTTTFPGEFFDEHAESIAAGIISGMMLMPGKPWTKLDSGASYGRIFGAAVRDLRGKIRDGGQPNASTFTGPRFGA